MRKIVLAGGLSLVAGAALAQEDGPGPNLVIDVGGQGANGQVVIDLLPDVAPKNVAQVVALAKSGEYDNVVFHRVIDGFMAQTGDVQFGKGEGAGRAGTGGSALPDLPAEFSDVPFTRGAVGMARTQDPNSANSQFFIMFAPGDFLNGQYTVIGHVIKGMDVVDAITKGEPPRTPDRMVHVTVQE
ncbi:peptidylprolyl isomerase [Falsirhodobacter sp. 20TX0035]|uniref:peptidylprolyl isomerase n=1 Tax=Falsirhodobacter sp. 20TX0035 TaxID=3022019 RepID=UPI00232EBE19|nr:peptidylprolyl isomerase [Falsirhodobacter sp. 20TX0035]MDB6453318.1 peptidylprolyl isomerase [Falsirhodobacter sp. 20TX0035]